VRRGSLVRVVAIGVLVGLVAGAIAIFIPWLPDQASEEGERIDFVFWFVTVICIVIFAVVAAVTIYSVIKFRAPPDDDSDGPPIHGHTGLEIAWTAVPTVLVTAIAAVSAVALAKNESLPSDRLVVEVTGRQFAWTFAYPRQDRALAVSEERLCNLPPQQPNCPVSGVLRLPRGRSVELRLRALDVLHSFSVPEFRQKQDAVPARPNEITRLKITPTKTGEYPVACYELCGIGHALMRTKAIVLDPLEFERWLTTEQGRLTPQGGQG
jgi:cytochrome c oxidase subunit II